MHWIKKLAIRHKVDEDQLREAVHIYWARNVNDVIQKYINEHIDEIICVIGEKDDSVEDDA